MNGGPKGPTRFVNGMRQAYLERIREGGRRLATARSLGIDPRTVQRAMRDRNGELTSFGHKVIEAEMEGHELVEDAHYKTALGGNVTAQINILYNRMPERWKDMRSVAISGPAGGPIGLHHTSALDAVFARIDDMAARIAGRETAIEVTEPAALEA